MFSFQIYPDVPADHWGRRYIFAGTLLGIVQGDPEGTFRPDANITRAEATAIAVRTAVLSLAFTTGLLGTYVLMRR